MVIQMTGLSGAGKSTIAERLLSRLQQASVLAEVMDADLYRQTLNKDLGFSAEDRKENMRRLGQLAAEKATDGRVVIIAAINPFEEIRRELKEKYNAYLVWISCSTTVLIERDTKGLYKRALLPEGHPDKISNLTGINHPFDVPADPDLVIPTDQQSVEASVEQAFRFILSRLAH
jgi:adenylylsulfate kinase